MLSVDPGEGALGAACQDDVVAGKAGADVFAEGEREGDVARGRVGFDVIGDDDGRRRLVDEPDLVEHHGAVARAGLGRAEAVAPDLGQAETVVRCAGRLLRAARERLERQLDLLPTDEIVGERGLEPLGRVGSLVDPHVVDRHLLREREVASQRATEVAAQRHVEQQVDRVVEHPLTGDIARGGRVVQDVVDIPVDEIGLPLDRERVIVVRHAGDVLDVAEGVATGVTRTVDRAEDLVGNPADVLHDVDFAGLRPFDQIDVGTETPEGRPQAVFTIGHLDPRLDSAVRELCSLLRHQPGGGVVAGAVVALFALGFTGGDHQIALTIGGDVVGAVGVVLQLGVTPAGDAVDGSVSVLVSPVGRVRSCSLGFVELVAPHERPSGRTGIGGAIVQEIDRDLVARILSVVPEAQSIGASPVLTDREVTVEAAPSACDGDVRRITRQPGLASAHVEHQIHATVAVDVLLVSPGGAGLLVDVGLGRCAQHQRRVVQRRGVELGRRIHDHGNRALSAVAEPALDLGRLQ